ncbi:MAG: hypothetical protein U1F66_02305 [bacterium]
MNKPHSKWMPYLLSAAVIPGAGQWYLGQRLKGGFMMVVTLLLVMGGTARFLSVVFALANQAGVSRPPRLNPFPVLGRAWHLDEKVLLAFLLSLAAIWLLSILDLWLQPKEDSAKCRQP